MRILTLLWTNLRAGVMTLRFPDRPPVSEGYRGLVRFDPSLCIGCAMCRFRCTSRAITFEPGKTDFTWSYDPGRCTFCGRCVEGCKEHALTQERACPPIYLNAGELRQSWTLPRRPPPRKPATAPDPAPAKTAGEVS
ncbi:MAG TPA: 4Fe-4S binding protein [Acidobacteriaceae bacterium]|nr:4Fe-4S binding protein [Acidobacteriaceae bacterium]